MKVALSYLACPAALATVAALTSTPTLAQEASAYVDEVVVTARRRDETAISVPVSVTALSAAQLDQHAVRTFDDIAMLTPGLTVSQVSGGVGGTIVLRGIGTAAGTNPSFDQTVSVNVDGVQISRGNALRLGQIDMQGIEILRGPQALFFGKNSPAGVISVRTADPTDEFEASVRGGYEPYGEETSATVTISGPLASSLRARLTGSMSNLDGWMDNDAHRALGANQIVPGAAVTTTDQGPVSRFWFTRGTVLFDPTDDLRFRAKYSYSKDTGAGFQMGGFQRINCPNGAASVAGQAAALGAPGNAALMSALAVDDCRADDHFTNGDIRPATLATALPHVTDAAGDHAYTQSLGSLEANYSLTPAVTLTSVTGATRLSDKHYDHFSFGPSDALGALDFSLRTLYDSLSEELRVTTDFSNSPVNAMFGAFYEDTDFQSYVWRFAAPDSARPRVEHFIGGETLSAFAQASWNVTEHLELSVGARWSQEKKDYRVEVNGAPQVLGLSEETFDNISPEATFTWRPSDRMTAYVAYKTGFKSGGFSAPYTSGSATTPQLIAANITGANNSYDPEEAEGGELGFKVALLDGSLRINSAVYYYEYTDLQVNSIDNSTGLPIIKVTNAAAATIQGAEADFALRVAGMSGLEFHGAVNYNEGEYDEFIAPCHIGQTIGEGCNLGVLPNGRFTQQDLSNKQLVNSPRWTASLGMSLEHEIGASGLAFGFSTDLSYKSDYMPHPDWIPAAEQNDVTFVSGTLRLSNAAQGWDVALIGRNLTNKFRVTTSSQAPTTGNSATTGTATSGGHPDLTGYVTRGRELWLQFTAYPSRWLD